MKEKFFIVLILGLLCISVTAQKVKKPTKTSSPPTVEQREQILEGIKLHDAKKYDEAIELYKQVLEENPDYALAIYELALSYYATKDLDKTIETAYRLIQYKGKEGILGYGLFANAVDDKGNPDDAIKIYQSAIKILKKDPDYSDHLSSLYFNLGITYTRQKKYDEAREALKKSVETNFQYASPNYILAENFLASKYKLPAVLAASRLISLERNSNRAKRSASIIKQIFKPAQQDDKGSFQIMLNLDVPDDEGDFGAVELLLGLGSVPLNEEKEKGIEKTPNEQFADSFESIISFLASDKDLRKTFVGKTYIPFMADMKQKGYMKHFAYLILQQNGDLDAEKWLVDSGQQTVEFFDWMKTYQLK